MKRKRNRFHGKVRVLMGFRAPGLRTKINRATGLPRNWSRSSSSPMLFRCNPKASPRIKIIQQFLFFKRFYKFFSTLLVFHSYLELFIDLINIDTVTCQGSKDKTRQDHYFFHTMMRQIKSLKSRPLFLSSSSGLLVFTILVAIPSKQQSTLWRYLRARMSEF